MKNLKHLRVLLVNGSPHEHGNTSVALAEIASTLAAERLEVDAFWIGANPVRGCIACGACNANASGHCAFHDDPCNALIDRIAAADALVVAAPVYYGQPAGQLLSLLQRACFAGAGVVRGKPVASVAVCRRGGSTAAFQCLNMPFLMLDCLVVGSQYWNIAFGRAPGEAARDAEGMQTMRTLARNLAWLLKNLHAPSAIPLPAREPWQPMHFIR